MVVAKGGVEMEVGLAEAARVADLAAAAKVAAKVVEVTDGAGTEAATGVAAMAAATAVEKVAVVMVEDSEVTGGMAEVATVEGLAARMAAPVARCGQLATELPNLALSQLR